MTREWCATMWLPRPITQRSPIRSTGTGPRSWPGTIPADRLTWAPIRVPSPIVIQRSPKIERGGLPPGRGVRGHHAVPLRGLEGPVHRPPAQPAKQGPAAHLPAEEGAEVGAEEGAGADAEA